MPISKYLYSKYFCEFFSIVSADLQRVLRLFLAAENLTCMHVCIEKYMSVYRVPYREWRSPFDIYFSRRPYSDKCSDLSLKILRDFSPQCATSQPYECVHMVQILVSYSASLNALHTLLDFSSFFLGSCHW